MIKRNKNIALMGVALGMMLLMTGCDSPKDKVNISKWEKQALKNASAYIEEKYGYKAKVKDCECGRFDSLLDVTPRSKCLVTMEYEDKEFYVWIDGDSKNTDGIDNYQAEEVINTFNEEVEKCIGEKPVYIQLMQEQCGFTNPEGKYDNMFHTYYDGTNLYELLSEDSFECAIFFDNGRDVSNDSFDEIGTHIDYGERIKSAEFNEISFVSEEALKTAKDLVISELRSNNGVFGIADEMIYVDNTHSVVYPEKNAERDKYKIVKVQCDDIICCYYEDEEENWELQKAENEIDIEEFAGHGFSDPTGLSDSYLLKNQIEKYPTHPYIKVYIPKEMISGRDMDKVKIAYQYIFEDGKLQMETAHLNEVGDYYAGTIACSLYDGEIQFMIATNKD